MRKEKIGLIGYGKFEKIFLLFLVVFIFIPTTSLFANNDFVWNQPAVTGEGLDRLGSIVGFIVSFFSSPIMRGICMIALAGLGILVLTNRGEPGLVKKFIPWVIGCTILMALSGITSIVFPNAASGN